MIQLLQGSYISNTSPQEKQLPQYTFQSTVIPQSTSTHLNLNLVNKGGPETL